MESLVSMVLLIVIIQTIAVNLPKIFSKKPKPKTKLEIQIRAIETGITEEPNYEPTVEEPETKVMRIPITNPPSSK